MEQVKTEGDAAMEAARRTFATESTDTLIEGTQQLQRAAALGNGEATAMLAHFMAGGVLQQADWDGSLDRLQRAAELGWKPALEELRLLARDRGDDPKALRARVDIRAWIAPKPTEVVSTAPRIRTIPGFMSPDECSWIIERGRSRLKRATVYDNDRGGEKPIDERSNSDFPFRLLDVDIVLVLLHSRMANSIGLPVQFFEPSTLLHYAVGQRFEPHHDFLDANLPGLAADIQQNGQRIATLLVYLNEDFEGGETDFPRVGYRFKGKTGDALVFANVSPTGQGDESTLHAGLPPTRGEKWLLSQWVRDRASM